jgi:lysine decarboxylase
MLHVARESLVSTDAVDRAVRLVRSTSPSSLLLSSLDTARRNMAVNGRSLLDQTLAALDEARAQIELIPGLEVVGEELDGEPGVHDTDPLRLVLDTRGTGESGFAMADSLRVTGDVSVELATDAVVVMVIGVAEDPAQLARLVKSVEVAAAAITPSEHPALPIDVPAAFKAELAVSPREAFLGATEVVDFESAVDRICGESIAVYPPGIPALLPGERITNAIIAHLREQVAKGARLHGASDPELRTIHVLPDEAINRRHR